MSKVQVPLQSFIYLVEVSEGMYTVYIIIMVATCRTAERAAL